MKATTIEQIRYWLALVAIVQIPGGLLYWIAIHPFVNFWKKVGYKWGLMTGFSVLLLMATLMILLREPLLAIQFGTSLPLFSAGLMLLVFGGWIRHNRKKKLGFLALIGLPELAPQTFPSSLLTQGIYGHIRHPRYVEYFVVVLSYAMISNYLAIYVTAVFTFLMIAWIIPQEEQELASRFGEPYEAYRRSVPAVIPRFGV